MGSEIRVEVGISRKTVIEILKLGMEDEPSQQLIVAAAKDLADETIEKYLYPEYFNRDAVEILIEEIERNS